MINADLILFSLLFVTLVNIARYLTALRSLIYMMREANPLLYQQVNGPGFFSTNGDMAKQVRLFHYLKSREYIHHHDPLFIRKCERVRQSFVVSVFLLGVTMLSAFLL